MIIIGLILSVFAIGFLCWLLFTLAVYALPFFCAVTVGLVAFQHGAGVAGALVLAAIAGIATLLIGQFAFASIRSPIVRLAVAIAFAAPAAIAGYHAAYGLSHIGVSSETWRTVFATVGAICVGATALVRIAAMAGVAKIAGPISPTTASSVAAGPSGHL